MTDPKELEIGARYEGILPNEPVTVLEIRPAGPSALVRYSTGNGEEGNSFLTPDRLAAVVPATSRRTWRATWPDFQLGIQALALRAVPHEGRLVAVSASNITPLPHQVQAVYHEILPHDRLRFLLADDPGAGKTIMTGLYLKEVLASSRATRVLIVAPGSLTEQWVDEMWSRFGLSFVELGTQHLVTDPSGRPRLEEVGPLVVARIDQVARNEDLMDAVLAEDFDVVVVDEAHKMSARRWGNRILYSKRYQLGQALAGEAEHLLLLTATPHNGKPDDFALFMELLGVSVDDRRPVLDQAPVRRLVKEQLVHADGSALFPPRVASTLNYAMTPSEQVLYDAVTHYVAEEMNKSMDESVRRTVGFAMTVLQRRLASSPEAILRSLERRHVLLESALERAERHDANLAGLLRASLDGTAVPTDDDEPDDEQASTASASRTPAELRTELLVLADLVAKASEVRRSGIDQKWEALKSFLTSPDSFDETGTRRKVIIFTEHRDTLRYLEERLEEVLGPSEYAAVIHGQVQRHERRRAQHDFTHDPLCGILLATDAAGEGVNLQVANLMVNYDIPWNPNRLEQRFGRIHRIGQDRTCYLWNLVASDTREGAVFQTLLEKLAVQRDALGDRVFDVLGDVLSGAELSEILTDAIRNQDPGAALSVLEERLGTGLADELAIREASTTEFSQEDLVAIQRRLEWARARDPQPDMVPDFARAALHRSGAEVHSLGDDTVWRVPYVPQHLAALPGVAKQYGRLHLVRQGLVDDDAGESQFLAPGHPLLNALVERIADDLSPALRDGMLLEDPHSATDYLLITLDEDGRPSTWRWDPAAGRTRVSTDAALDLSPSQDTDTGWAASLVDAAGLDEGSLLAIAAVRGLASEAAADQHARAVVAVGQRLEQEGRVVAGDQGAGYDFVVESGPSVRFIVVGRAASFGRHDPLRSEGRLAAVVPVETVRPA